MSPIEEVLQRLEQYDKRLELIQGMARDLVDDLDRVIRDSDRRAEEYLPILRRAGLVPPKRRSRWW